MAEATVQIAPVKPIIEVKTAPSLIAPVNKFFEAYKTDDLLCFQRAELMDAFDNLREKETGPINITDKKFLEKQNNFLADKGNENFVAKILGGGTTDLPADKINNWAYFKPEVGPRQREPRLASYRVIKTFYDYYQKNPAELTGDSQALAGFCQMMFGEKTGATMVKMINQMVTTNEINFGDFQKELNTYLSQENTPLITPPEIIPLNSSDDLEGVRKKLETLVKQPNSVAPETKPINEPVNPAEPFNETVVKSLPKLKFDELIGKDSARGTLGGVICQLGDQLIPIEIYQDPQGKGRLRCLYPNAVSLQLIAENGQVMLIGSNIGTVVSNADRFIINGQRSRLVFNQGWQFQKI